MREGVGNSHCPLIKELAISLRNLSPKWHYMKMLLFWMMKGLLPVHPEGMLCGFVKPRQAPLALQNKKSPLVTNTRIHLHGKNSLAVKAHFSTNQPLPQFGFCTNHTSLMQLWTAKAEYVQASNSVSPCTSQAARDSPMRGSGQRWQQRLHSSTIF